MGDATQLARRARTFSAAGLALLLAACAASSGPPVDRSEATGRRPLDAVAREIAAIPDAVVEARDGGTVLVTFPADLFFPEGRALLTRDGEERLAAFAARVREYPDAVLRVLGHSDLDGSESFNLDLSEDRAEGVRRGLVEQGISPTRVGAAGFGAEFPVATNDTEEGRTRNRRIEIEIQPDAAAHASSASPAGR